MKLQYVLLEKKKNKRQNQKLNDLKEFIIWKLVKKIFKKQLKINFPKLNHSQIIIEKFIIGILYRPCNKNAFVEI